MKEIQQKIGIANENWLMSAREKLILIGLLDCLKPKKVIEFGFHRGGATKWLSQYAEKVITVDVNEHVSNASTAFPNVQAWNCSTMEAIARINDQKLNFDLAVVDADHSRKAVAQDVRGLLPYSEIILMHDSFNPECRKGMLDTLLTQDTHAYNLDFVPSVVKDDGLWGGIGIAWRSNSSGFVSEFAGESSPYPLIALQNLSKLSPKIHSLVTSLRSSFRVTANKLRIIAGKYFR